jgi:hypothetical protein
MALPLVIVVAAVAQVPETPAPPTGLRASDHAWDTGEKIDLRWKLSADDETIDGYWVYRSLTRTPEEIVAVEEAAQQVVAQIEADDAAEGDARSAATSLVPRLQEVAESAHAESYEYDGVALAAADAVEAWLNEPGAATAVRAVDAIEEFLEEPKSEVQKEIDQRRTVLFKAAELEATERIVRPILDGNWKDKLQRLSPEVRQQVLDARATARERAQAEWEDLRSELPTDTWWQRIAGVDPGTTRYTVEKLDRFQEYVFKVTAIRRAALGDGAEPVVAESPPAETRDPLQPRRSIYDGARLPLNIIVFVICGSVMLYIWIARTGKPLNVRKIAGLAAVDEAVGRATEMGRPVLFVPGTQDMNDIQTIAGITVLSRVAKTAAEYDARVEVPTARSLVMTTCRETVQASYLEAGRPDAFNEDDIYYVTDEQFGYVAYLQGMMARQKPAACFYMGTFFAESLILAETGNSIGAIQIAGTAMPAQLPFFVAACDYTLIGEEFFAASAYLSGEPDQLGALKGQDVGKLIVAGFVLIGVAMFTIGSAVLASDSTSELGASLIDAVEYLKQVILT